MAHRAGNAAQVMVVAVLGLLAVPAITRGDGDATIGWRDIVGIIQPGNAVGTGQGGQVLGGGQPWTTLGGHANVNLSTGHIEFEVQGLVFAGGNTIGTPVPFTQVRGTLVCDTNGSVDGTSKLVDTPLVDLDATGNARFAGDVGSLPSECMSESDIAFLVRLPVGRWVANGAVLRR